MFECSPVVGEAEEVDVLDGKKGEAEAFRELVRAGARERVSTAVLVKEGNLIKTISGKTVGHVTAEAGAGLGLRGVGGALFSILDLATIEPPPDHPENILLAPFELGANIVQRVFEALAEEPGDAGKGGGERAGPGPSGGAGGAPNH